MTQVEKYDKLLFGETNNDSLISEFQWKDCSLRIWIYTFNISRFLRYFKNVLDGTNYKELIWTGDSICIEHFEEWLPDLDESELFALFPDD